MIKLTPVTLILILVPFLSFVSPSCFMFTPLSVFYVFSLSIIPFYLFIFSFLFLSFPLAFLRAGHQVTSLSPHTCIQSTLYECVCLCVLNFHFNQHVSKRTILLPQGRTEGPLHNLSLTVSFPLPRLVPSLHPSFSETTN